MCKGRAASHHLSREVCNTRLADLATRKSDFRYFKGVISPKDLLCGFSEKGMKEVRATKSSGNDWWNPTIRGIDTD